MSKADTSTMDHPRIPQGTYLLTIRRSMRAIGFAACTLVLPFFLFSFKNDPKFYVQVHCLARSLLVSATLFLKKREYSSNQTGALIYVKNKVYFIFQS